jgi:hypothetical protein
MPTFRIGDETYESGPIPIGLGCEAEKALGVSMQDGGFALFAIQLYVAQRQAHPDKPSTLIADEVMRADFVTLSVEEEENGDPLADEPEEGAESEEAEPEEPTDRATTGRPLSVRSA